MKFSVGDKVLLKRSGEEGHIVSFLSDIMLEVEVDGTRFPVYTEEVDHPYLKWFTEKKKEPKKKPPEQLPVEKEAARPKRLAQGIYLSFMPVYQQETTDDIVDHLKIYLLNESPVSIRFSYDARSAGGDSIFAHQGILHPFGHLYLHPLSLEAMNEQPRFHWSVADSGKGLGPASQRGIVRIRPARLFDHIHQLLENGEPTFSYLLTEDASLELAVEASPVLEMGQSVQSTFRPPAWWQPKLELDLHIDRLVSDTRNMSHAEMLQLQLDTLRYHLDMAVAHRQERMIIIHGVGKGVLRQEVHKLLDANKGVESYSKEWLGLYGFGATEVLFKR